MMRLRILPSAMATLAFGVLVISGCTLGAPAGNNERGGGTDVEGPPSPADEVTSSPADEVTPSLADEVTSSPADEVTPSLADEVTPSLVDEVTVAKNHAVVIQTVADDADERDIVALIVTQSPAHGQAEPRGELAVRYAPRRHFTGVDEFHYGLVRPEGEVETVVVTVQVVDEDWVVVAGEPLLLSKVDVPSSDDESGTTVTDVITDGSIVGYTGPPSQPRGFLRRLVALSSSYRTYLMANRLCLLTPMWTDRLPGAEPPTGGRRNRLRLADGRRRAAALASRRCARYPAPCGAWRSGCRHAD